jgi:hypothetical protein
MNGGGYRHPLVERIGYHLARVRAWARRVTLTALSVRLVIWLAGWAALVVASPVPPAIVAPAAALVALLPAGFPRTGVVSFVELLAIGLFAAEPELWPALLVAGLLYVHHTTSALGAQVRTDTVIPAAALWHWARRAALVLACASVVSLAIAALASGAPVGWATAYLALGAAAAVAITVYLAWSAHRPAE